MGMIQSGASIAKELFPIWGVVLTTMVRTLFGFIFLSFFWFPKKEILKSSWRPALAYGFSLGSMNLCFYFALNRLPLGLAVALEFLGPLSLSLLNSKKAIDIVWALLAALGVIVLLLPSGLWEGGPGESPSLGVDPLGVIFALIAALAWAFYIVCGKRLGQVVQGGYAASLGMLGAAISILPLGLFQFDILVEKAEHLPAGMLLALLSSAIPYALEMFALRNIPTKTFGILMALEPVVASIIGFLLLKETLSSTQIIAIAMITLAGQGSLWLR
jgi:inner membrane transporter RhtA